jgi:hypothetical protein
MMIVFQDTPKETPKHAGPGGNRTVWAPAIGAILLKGLADLPAPAGKPIRSTFRPNASSRADGAASAGTRLPKSAYQGVTADG